MHYRGSKYYGWEGVYTHLLQVGGLMPYAESVEDLVEQQFHRYYSWLEAMDSADVERQLFLDSGGELLTAAWNPLVSISWGLWNCEGWIVITQR
ncbi:MAG: hypothetical protein BRC54_10465 [Cyanobacteria bacterium SW_7_48_12]|nr:MAG: hypothetical protein BRC54_10465 [Cyanobacteria bacterium SW_7_48_12]